MFTVDVKQQHNNNKSTSLTKGDNFFVPSFMLPWRKIWRSKELTPIWKGGKTENGRVASPASVSSHLNPIALRMAKTRVLAILSAIGLSTCRF